MVGRTKLKMDKMVLNVHDIPSNGTFFKSDWGIDGCFQRVQQAVNSYYMQ